MTDEQLPPTHSGYGQEPTPPPPPYSAPYSPPNYPQAPSGYGAPQPSGYPPYGYPAPAPAPDGLGIGAMVVGIIALIGACGYGITLLAAPAALIMGRVSMKKIDRSNGAIGGRGFAQAGFILGIIGTVLLVLAIIVVVVVIVMAVNGVFDDSSYETTYSSLAYLAAR